MSRPSLASAIAALQTEDPRFDWVHPTLEEADIAAVLEVVEADHQGDGDEPDGRGHWGRCRGCGQPWPCPRFIDAEQLAIEWLGRAADRVAAHARAVMDQTKESAA